METFAPSALTPVDDRLNANSALRRVRAGEYLLYEGDFINAKQLLAAMGRRLRGRAPSGSPIQIFRAQRRTRELEHHALSHLVVALDGEYRLALRRAPNVAQAARWAWGEPRGKRTLVSLKTLLGVIGAAEWRRKGLRVAGLQGTLHPHYGVYLPTRTDYVELVQEVPEVSGKRVLDVGTGTGILSFLLLQRGAKYAVGSDSEPRAIACARENAQHLGLADRFEAVEADVFPQGKADLVISNPPWIPEAAKNWLDLAVFDQEHRFLSRYLEGLAEHLEPGGVGLLLLSNLAVLLGLTSPQWLEEKLAQARLRVSWTRSTQAKHPKSKDSADPLHAVRSREVVTLYALDYLGDDFRGITVFDSLGKQVPASSGAVLEKGVTSYNYKINLKPQKGIGYVLKAELAEGKELHDSFKPAYGAGRNESGISVTQSGASRKPERPLEIS